MEFLAGARLAAVAALPSASSYPNTLLVQGGKPYFSNGTSWIDLSIGVAAPGSDGQIPYKAGAGFAAGALLSFNPATGRLTTGTGVDFVNAGIGVASFRPIAAGAYNGAKLEVTFDPNVSATGIYMYARDGSLAEANEIHLVASSDSGAAEVKFIIDNFSPEPVYVDGTGVSRNMLHSGNTKTINGQSLYGAGTFSLVDLSTNQTVSGNKTFNGFTKLGELAPNIKQKLITGTTSNTLGASVTAAHGLTTDKIIGIQALVVVGSVLYTPRDLSVGSDFGVYIDGANVVIRNGSSASNIRNRPFRCLITYQE